ncbi:MAG: hypothetical protein B7X02_02890, partial [Rhodospirillales bacterium 12-54-5]
LVGNALAIALAQGGLAVTVVDPLPRSSQVATAFDGRTSAISQASVRVLSHMGVWQQVAAQAQPIHDIRVCEEEKPGFVHYSDREVGEPFGYILENTLLRRALFQVVEAEPNITLLSPDAVTGFSRGEAIITAELKSGHTLTAPLLIAADGRLSGLRKLAGIPHRVIEYGQTAIVCVMEHELPHHGLALEKFYSAGPFALLPLTDAGGVHRSGVVWTERTDDATHYLALPDAEFDAELQQRVGAAETSVWGSIKTISQRWSYPLRLMHADHFTAERFALVGDSAHGIHPIAGQGVNLGYRDVAVMAELILDQRKLGLDIGAPSVLARYQRWRAFDSMSMTASTDLLNRLFMSEAPGLSLLRRTGMRAVNRMPRLKGYFMRH